MSSSTLSPPWMKNRKTENLPIFRTGIDKTLDMDEPIYQQPKQQEPIYQQPTNQNKPVLIEQPGLFYNGHHFMQFLRQYEMTADSLNATKYDRALQIGRFVRTEELKCQINGILYGPQCLNYGKQFRSRQDALVIFISAFPQELQRNIKRNLNQNGQLPQAPNGSRLPPLWEHLTEAAGVEIKLKELAKELEALKQQLQESQSPVICNTPHPLPQVEPRTENTELATEYTEPVTEYTEPRTENTELATEYTEPATEHTEPVTEHTEPWTENTELATEYTEPATEHTEPVTEHTEPVTEHTEPVTENTELVTDHTEPEANYTELTIADTEKSMDVTIPAASMNMTESVTTTKLLDLEEWKAASINVMDTPMELVHTVIKIPDIILDVPDTEINVDQEESLDQSTQPETLDHLPNLVKIENLLLA
ncbi:hypothetical protein PGT21_014692 [Puccinia graminis f. sp. tritici]|uniref:Uncharacterized protein n=1 Tax=Puccinia graminis f. sp. tritici TaxID=56615 RepID=A0A5B0P5K3_PUCGR|nr:hypothetical protein PGT21_014692 [Puccinia graminis f. sp. tritici]